MKRFLVFTLCKELFAFNVGYAVEVLSEKPVKRVPELPDFISGLVDVRGDMVPVVDMRQRFGMSKGDSRKRKRFLIVRTSLGRIALIVDEVLSIVDMSQEKVKKPPMLFRGISKKYLEGLYKIGELMYIVLNIEEILTSEEKIILERANVALKGKRA